MTTFAVTSTDQTLDAVNYLLSNLGQAGNVGNATIPTGTLIGNTTSGIVSTYNAGGGNAYSYLYQYINLRYANNATGTSGFSTLPGNANFFGVYNSATSAASSVPAAYTYYEVAGGFGTTKTIFYSTQGGRQIQLVPANVAPSSSFIQSTANVAIDLDVVTTAAGTPGSRGPIAMAYVVTPSTPVGASDLQLTAWWEAARDSLTPPIGTGLTPVVGDTGTFIYGAGVGTPSETYEFNGSGWTAVVQQVISGNVVVANSMPGTAITASSITGNRIAANTITGNTILVSTITGNLIAGNTITGNLIAANTITGNLIAANTITANNISTDYLYTGNIVSFGANIGNNSSSGFWLQNNTGNARFGGNISIGNSANIGSNLIVGDNAVIGSNVQIGGNLSVVGLITSGALNSNTVDTAQLVPNAVVSTKIADNAITTSKIIADAVTATQIANQAVSNAKIALATITGNLVQSQTLTGNLIALNTITGNLVATGTITATNIATGTITATQIAASTITASQIAAGTITATQIATGTITATNIQSGTITGTQIAAGTVTATNIQSGTITASQIAANTITATQISTAYVYAGNIVSFGATLGSNTSPGYWLQYNTGNARFGGNVSIGNNLAVGANATVGANLTVSGLITTGSLNSNTVATTTMVAAAVSNGNSIQSNTDNTVSTPTINTDYFDTGYGINVTTVEANQPVYIYGQISLQSLFTVTSTVTQISVATGLYRQNPDTSYTLVKASQTVVGSLTPPGSYLSAETDSYVGYLDTPSAAGTYKYIFAFAWSKTGGTMTMSSQTVTFRNLLLQTLKR